MGSRNIQVSILGMPSFKKLPIANEGKQYLKFCIKVVVEFYSSIFYEVIGKFAYNKLHFYACCCLITAFLDTHSFLHAIITSISFSLESQKLCGKHVEKVWKVSCDNINVARENVRCDVRTKLSSVFLLRFIHPFNFLCFSRKM